MYHPALLVTIPIIVNCIPLQFNEFMYDFSLCNFNVINSQIASIDWSEVFKDQCINNAVTKFYTIIFEIIDKYCTKKKLHISKYPVWFSSKLKDLIFKKKLLTNYINNLLLKLITIFFLIFELNVNFSPR